MHRVHNHIGTLRCVYQGRLIQDITCNIANPFDRSALAQTARGADLPTGICKSEGCGAANAAIGAKNKNCSGHCGLRSVCCG